MLQIIEHHGLGGHQFGAGIGKRFGECVGDDRDAVAVAVEQVAGVDPDAADAHGDVQIGNLAVAVRANCAVRETGKF